jgi:hypothetical protein
MLVLRIARLVMRVVNPREIPPSIRNDTWAPTGRKNRSKDRPPQKRRAARPMFRMRSFVTQTARRSG